ncbi:hypothetical protein Q6249_29370, partial [Klebsiella pneumoniae]|uniref:hypothetical protein n=1 Tax=Klebsiella pneumoniae TaxID=573 RepID=UPI002732145F
IIFLYQILVTSVPKFSFEIQSRIKAVSSKSWLTSAVFFMLSINLEVLRKFNKLLVGFCIWEED